ncbi:hypothetical protein HK105_205583 [Polyrhizophydium stewartii]|uniref:G-protein coupled receptors family 3 profile domain-containing protein n=1 Tax=Polyrhizophydium stewartii TaxID=2732419 RepID=A0ABR4N5N5_9FUNG
MQESNSIAAGKARAAWAAWAAALGVLLVAAPPAEAARSTNKTESRVGITVVTDSSTMALEQLYFGIRMAVLELNANTTFLQDVTIYMNRLVMPSFSTKPATVYDSSITMCDSGNQLALAETMSSTAAMAANMVCPKYHQFSTNSAIPALSDKTIYPLFFRFVTNLGQKIRISVSIFKYFGWSKIGMVYGASGLWPPSAATALQYFPQAGIDIVAIYKVPDYKSSLSQYYYPQIKAGFEYLRSTNIRVFLLAVSSSNIIDIMMAANRTDLVGPNYVWVSIQSGVTYDTAGQARWDTTLDPSVMRGVLLTSSQAGPFASDPFYQAWFTRMQAFVSYSIANDASLYTTMNFAQTNTKSPDYPQNFFFDDPGTNTLPSSNVLIGYDGMMAIARAWEAAIIKAGTNGQALANGSLLSSISLNDVTSQLGIYANVYGIKVFASSGDPVVNPYFVNQIDGTSLAGGTINTGTMFVDPVSGAAMFTPDPAKFFWSGNRSFSDVPISYVPSSTEYPDWASPGVRFMIAISSLASLYCLGLATGLMVLRAEPLIRAASPYILFVTALGLAIVPLNVYTLIDKHKSIGCSLRAFPIGLGLTIALSSMGAKASAAHDVALQLYSSMLMQDKALYVMTAIMTGLMGIILIVFRFVAPIQEVVLYIEAADRYVYTCGTTTRASTAGVIIVMVIIILLMLGVIALAYAIRGIPDQFNDVKELSYGFYLIFVFGAVLMAEGFSDTSSVSRQFYVENITISIATILVATFMVGMPIFRQLTTTAIFKLRSTSRSSKSSHSRSTANASASESDMLSDRARSPPASKRSGDLLGRGGPANAKSSGDVLSDKEEDAGKETDKEGPSAAQIARAKKKQKKIEAKTLLYRDMKVETKKAMLSPDQYAKFKTCKAAMLKEKSAVILRGKYLPQWRRIRFMIFLDPANVLRFTLRAEDDGFHYVNFIGIRSMRAIEASEFGFQNVIDMQFDTYRILVPFEDHLLMHVWANAIARMVVSHTDPAQIGSMLQNEYFSEFTLTKLVVPKIKVTKK